MSSEIRGFEKIAADVERLAELVKDQDVEVEVGSPFEAIFYLSAELASSRKDFENAVDGLGTSTHEAMRWVNGAQQLAAALYRLGEDKLPPLLSHLHLMGRGNPSAGARSAPSNDASRKLFELFVAAVIASVTVDVEVAADDDTSQRNPDVLCTFEGRRTGFACKVFQGSNPATHADRVEEGLQQLEASDAETGLVTVSIRNALPFESVFDARDAERRPFSSDLEARHEIDDAVRKWWEPVREELVARGASSGDPNAFPRAILVYIEVNVLMDRDGHDVCTTFRYFHLLEWGDELEFHPRLVRLGRAANDSLHGKTPWRTLFEYEFSNDGPRERTYLSSGEAQRCIFCGRTAQDGVTFSKDAHVIPAALGNRTLYSLEECDECNKSAGDSIENDFINSMTLVRAIARKRTRKGHAKHKPAGGESYIKSGVSSDVVQIAMDDEVETIEVVDKGDSLVVSCPIPSYRPANVARSLIRMAIMAMPIVEGRAQLTHLLPFLSGEDVGWWPTYCQFTLAGTGLHETQLAIKRYYGEGYVWLLVSLAYGNRLLLAPIPNEEFEFPPTKIPMAAFFGEEVEQPDVVEFQKVSDDVEFDAAVETITFSYENLAVLEKEELKAALDD